MPQTSLSVVALVLSAFTFGHSSRQASPFMETTSYRADKEYRFPRWVGKAFGVFSMRFLFFPLTGRFCSFGFPF
ncbi:MAG: hypothetical protein MK165_12325 [Pirellulaceae bacterium]|nr:hypothetical protein [Pirellulaceae bacterium]